MVTKDLVRKARMVIILGRTWEQLKIPQKVTNIIIKIIKPLIPIYWD
jgi:hypothetical protein